MEKMRRSEVIEKLIEANLGWMTADRDWQLDVLRYGWKGYEQMTNEELEQTWKEQFEEEIKISPPSPIGEIIETEYGKRRIHCGCTNTWTSKRQKCVTSIGGPCPDCGLWPWINKDEEVENE